MKNKKQHFIPKSYIEAWCDSNTPSGQEPFIWIMPKNGVPGHPKAPQNTFTETNIYTIKLLDGSRNLTIEHGLSGLETQFAELRRNKLISHEELSIEDYAILCAFTAATHARTPKQRDHLEKMFSMPKMLIEKMREKIKTAQPHDRDIILKEMSSIPSGGPTFNYEEIKKLAESPLQYTLVPAIQAETPLLLQMDHAILFTDSSPGFITSDAPCVWFDPDAYSRPYPYNAPGICYPKIEITLPISPSQIFFLNRAGISGYIQITEAILDELNQRTCCYANEFFVVSHNQTKQIWFEIGSPPKGKEANNN